MHGAAETALLVTQKIATHTKLEKIIIIVLNLITIYLNSITTLSADSSVVKMYT
jgi:hypothetical protein